jgi:ribosomal protein L30/L7E
MLVENKEPLPGYPVFHPRLVLGATRIQSKTGVCSKQQVNVVDSLTLRSRDKHREIPCNIELTKSPIGTNWLGQNFLQALRH